MSLAPYSYRPLTPPGSVGSKRGHARSVSNASSYCASDISPESLVVGNPTPSRSPVFRQHGPTLLPKIRSQDSNSNPMSAGQTKSKHRRAVSAAPNAVANGMTRPAMYRSATEPVEGTNLMISPFPNISYSRVYSVMPSPASIQKHDQRSVKSHSRSMSASNLDTNVLNRYGYPTYRQMPVYLSHQHQQQTPSPVIYPETYLTYEDLPGLDPPMINLQGTFDMPIELDPISRESSESPAPDTLLSYGSFQTSSLLGYLTQATQPINLVRHLSCQPSRGMTHHFWWDVRNVRPWTTFSLSDFSTISDMLSLLRFQHDTDSLPNYTSADASSLQTITPASESDLTSYIAKIHFPRANTAAQLSLGASNAPALYAAPAPSSSSATVASSSHPSFLSNYPSDNDRTLTGLPRGRIVGLAKSFDKWNTGMRREAPPRKVEYLKGLSHLQKCMRDHSCRYGFIMTEIELVCVRAGCDERGNPFFGHIEVAEAIPTMANFNFDDMEMDLSSQDLEVPMTATLALYFLLMLAKATPLPGHPGSFMDVGGPGALTRQRTWHGCDLHEDEQGKEGRDKWIPEPQVGEKREARTVRGWVWPSDPWHKREGGGGKRRAM